MYKVLIADADPQQLNTLSKIICWEDCGLEVIGLLSDGRNVLQFLENHPVHILIASVHLPTLDGIQLLQELRARNMSIRCILTAEKEDFMVVQKAIPLDIENFLFLPLSPTLLLDTLLGAVQKLAQTHPQAAPATTPPAPPEIPALTNRNYSSMMLNHTFERHLVNQEYPHCLAYLDSLFQDAPSTIDTSLRNYAVELAVCISNYLRNCNIEVADILGADTDIFSHILSFRESQALHIWMRDFLTAAIEILETKNMRFSPCISRVVAYIEKNYAQDISLKTMAYEMNINAAYLGQLFKSETGQLFSVYLNRTRIENAKKMLLSGNHPLSEISVQCGYANISYFYNIFKKITDQTPSQFRKANAK